MEFDVGLVLRDLAREWSSLGCSITSQGKSKGEQWKEI